MVEMKASYMNCVLTPRGLREKVEQVVAALEPLAGEFECIAFRGMSGAVVAPPVACRLDKHMLMVRKQDGNHSPLVVEGPTNLCRYVVVDDLVQTGRTLRTIQRMVALHNEDARCVGVCLYNVGASSRDHIDFFRCNRDLAWLQLGSLEDRVARFHEMACKVAVSTPGGFCHDMLFGTQRLWDVDFGPAFEACFPRPEDREAAMRTATWPEVLRLAGRQLAVAA